jgi:hypothetical protein
MAVQAAFLHASEGLDHRLAVSTCSSLFHGKSCLVGLRVKVFELGRICAEISKDVNFFGRRWLGVSS